MVPYAAYLRIYEPLSAFGKPNRSRWNLHASGAAQPRMLVLTQEDAGASRQWCTRFRPYSLIELDHGEPVCLRSDQMLRTQAPVAGMATAIESPVGSEWEVAVAMHHRAHERRWCPRATVFAN